MNNPADLPFTIRPTVTIELPLSDQVRIARPDQALLKIGTCYHDIGSYCYALRSNKPRSRGQPRETVEGSFLPQRIKPISLAITYLHQRHTDAGRTTKSVQSDATWLKAFLDWCDANGLHSCLSGGAGTTQAYAAFCADLRERFRRHEISATQYNRGIGGVRELLEGITSTDDLGRIAQRIRAKRNPDAGMEPAQPDDFAHALALNQALFDGLSDLVLNGKPFPYRLDLPRSLNWNESFLWVFPLRMWCLPPHHQGAEREKLTSTHWAYDYEQGRLATPEEVAPKLTISRQRHAAMFRRHAAQRTVDVAIQFMAAANNDLRHWARVMLAMLAHNAFLFLFFANTGCNEAVAREIETDGHLDATTLNQNFRSIKFRAHGKPISLETPVTFLPSLRRFMELRRWLLNDSTFPYLFHTRGAHNTNPPAQLTDSPMEKPYNALLRLDPSLPRWGARKIRATVADYYQRQHDASITAKVLQNSPETALRRYNAGSPVEHRMELSIFLEKVAQMSSRQQVERDGAGLSAAKPLEEGGKCNDYGHPEAMAEGLPVEPDCKQGQGCLFCQHRVLIAGEEDARKVASAAFVMEQVILGPLHEAELRPLIQKCDDDLDKIAAFPGCAEMVGSVRKDVFEHGNLTPFFADKFQLFLELGVIA